VVPDADKKDSLDEAIPRDGSSFEVRTSHTDEYLKAPTLPDGDRDRFNHNFDVNDLQQGSLNLL
jgi:hypothetical protein